jgi:hypothetical protein
MNYVFQFLQTEERINSVNLRLSADTVEKIIAALNKTIAGGFAVFGERCTNSTEKRDMTIKQWGKQVLAELTKAVQDGDVNTQEALVAVNAALVARVAILEREAANNNGAAGPGTSKKGQAQPDNGGTKLECWSCLKMGYHKGRDCTRPRVAREGDAGFVRRPPQITDGGRGQWRQGQQSH